MALPATNLTLNLDASVTTRLWKQTGMTTHPAADETVQAWDDVGDATGFCMAQATAVNANGGFQYKATAWPTNGGSCLKTNAPSGNTVFRTYNDAVAATQAGSNFVAAGGKTIFIALYPLGNPSSTNTTQAWLNDFVFADSSQFWGLYCRNDSSQPKFVAYNWDGNTDQCTKNFALNTPYVVQLQHGGGTLTLDLVTTGGSFGSPASASSGNTTDLTGYLGILSGGSNSIFNGYYGEVAVYNAKLAGSDLTDAQNYFYNKWLAPAVTGGGPLVDPVLVRHPVLGGGRLVR